MATIYKVEITSHWISFPESEFGEMLNRAIKESKEFSKHTNEITVGAIEEKDHYTVGKTRKF